jgi:hypothetical protein
MANQASTIIFVQLLGDGVSTTATISLGSTPLSITDGTINFNPIPDSVSLPIVADANGSPIPATATLSKSGKQVLITLSAPFTGKITVTMTLGYNV